MAFVYRVSLAVMVLAAVSVLAVVGTPAARRPRNRRTWQAGTIPAGTPSDQPTCVEMTDHPCRRFFPGLETVGYPYGHLISLTMAVNEFRVNGFEKMVNNSECRANFPVMAALLCFEYFPPCTPMPNTVTPTNRLASPCSDMCRGARAKIKNMDNSAITASCPAAGEVLRRFPEPLSMPLLDCSKYPSVNDSGSVCVSLSYISPDVPTTTTTTDADTDVPPDPTMATTDAELPLDQPTCENISLNHPCRRLYPGLREVGYPPKPSDITHLTSYGLADFEFRRNGFDKMVNNSECRAKFPIMAAFLCAAYFPPCTPMPNSANPNRLSYPCDDMRRAARTEIENLDNSEIIARCPAASNFLRIFSDPLGLPFLERGRYPEGSGCIPLRNILPTEPPTTKGIDCEGNATVCATSAGSEITTPPVTTEPPTRPPPTLCSEEAKDPASYECDNCTCDECSDTSIRKNLSKRTFIVNYCTMEYAYKVRFIRYTRGSTQWGLEFEMLYSYFDDAGESPSIGTVFTISTTRKAGCCLCDEILDYVDKDKYGDIFIIAGKVRGDGTQDGRHLRHTAKDSLILPCSNPTRYSEDKMTTAVARRPTSGVCPE